MDWRRDAQKENKINGWMNATRNQVRESYEGMEEGKAGGWMDRWVMDARVDNGKKISGWMDGWKDRRKEGWKAGRPDAYTHAVDERTEKTDAQRRAGQADKWMRRTTAIRATDFLWVTSVF